MNIKKGDIANALKSVADDHVVATADAVYDETVVINNNTGAYQEDVNSASAYIENVSPSEEIEGEDPEVVPFNDTVHLTAQTLTEIQKQTVLQNLGLDTVIASLIERITALEAA